MSSWAWGSLIITVVAVALYAFSRYYRGTIRIRLASFAIFSGLAGTAITITLVAGEFGWTKSDLISVIGILLTIVLTFFASRYVSHLRRLRVGIVIPSLQPFHREVREGLRQTLDPKYFELFDPYASGNNPEEDLCNFIPTLHDALNARSDVLVICSPTVDLSNSPSLSDECRKFTRRGGHVFFIESAPSSEILETIGFVTTIISDTHQSAILQSDYILSRWNTFSETEKESGNILIVSGPTHSKPAQGRLAVLLSRLEDTPNQVVESLSWTSEESQSITKKAMTRFGSFRFICCGNDDMARGAALACHEAGLSNVEIVGHDGLYNTIVSISDPFSPLSATIRIPPKAYGLRIGALINNLSTYWGLVFPMGFWFYKNIKPTTVIIPITRANLITRHNASLAVSGK